MLKTFKKFMNGFVNSSFVNSINITKVEKTIYIDGKKIDPDSPKAKKIDKAMDHASEALDVASKALEKASKVLNEI